MIRWYRSFPSGRLRGASPGILGPRFGFLQDAGAPGGRRAETETETTEKKRLGLV